MNVFPLQLSTIILADEKSYGKFFDEKKVVETIKTTAENISKSQEKQKHKFARRKQKTYQSTVYHVGDEVLLFNMRKAGREEEFSLILPELMSSRQYVANWLHCLILKGQL